MRWQRAAGYSLVEVVAAIALFALVAAVLLGSLGRAMKQWQAGQQRTDAMAHLRLATTWIGRDARLATGASACTSPSDCTLQGATGSGLPPVRYTFADHTLTRTVGAEQVPVAIGLESVSIVKNPPACSKPCLQVDLQAGGISLSVTFAMRNL